ncbi:MAG: Sec-independent protein translocase protein TatB [Gammaproteobacteria bacterium]
MFDVGFFELALIGIILLIVVGPQRLPKLARFVGAWAGKANRAFQSVKNEVNRELAADELKRTLEKQTGSNDLYEIVEETKSDLNSIRDETDTALKESEQALEAQSSSAPVNTPGKSDP